MKRLVAIMLIATMILGAAYAAGAALSVGGVDRLLGDSTLVTFTGEPPVSCSMGTIGCTVVTPP